MTQVFRPCRYIFFHSFWRRWLMMARKRRKLQRRRQSRRARGPAGWNECGVRNAECGVGNERNHFGVRGSECEVRNECAMRAGQSEEAEVLMATPFNCGLWISDCGLGLKSAIRNPKSAIPLLPRLTR